MGLRKTVLQLMSPMIGVIIEKVKCFHDKPFHEDISRPVIGFNSCNYIEVFMEWNEDPC